MSPGDGHPVRTCPCDVYISGTNVWVLFFFVVFCRQLCRYSMCFPAHGMEFCLCLCLCLCRLLSSGNTPESKRTTRLVSPVSCCCVFDEHRLFLREVSASRKKKVSLQPCCREMCQAYR